ncbi:MAG: hypothetical protein AAF585_09120 [Verrucomicrobiota bacterium]
MAQKQSNSCLSDLFFFGCFGAVIIVACGGGGLLWWNMNAVDEPSDQPEPMFIESREIDESELPR